MILSDSEIKKNLVEGDIVITPFQDKHLNPNSYDLTLGKNLMVYDFPTLSVKEKPQTRLLEIHPEKGFMLEPYEFYLGVTNEFTHIKKHVPMLEGKSSIGRLGLFVHITAGSGDVGFAGHWTVELFTVKPLRIFAGMRIAQIIFHEVKGEVERPYDLGGRYNNKFEENPFPMESQMYKNFING